jgi:hypothetical protein
VSKFGHLSRSCDLFRHPAAHLLLVYQNYESEQLLSWLRIHLLLPPLYAGVRNDELSVEFGEQTAQACAIA